MSKEDDRQRAILQRLARMQASGVNPGGFVSTGFKAFDEVLGGGFPRGEIVELFGPSGCGKSTLAIQCVAALQRQGMTAAWIDADHTFDAAYARQLGVDVERVPFAQPASAEQGLEIARTLCASGAVDLLVIDSAAALVPQLELDVGIGTESPGLHARVLASGLRKLRPALRRSGACMLVLNQMRNRTGASGGEGETSAGGAPLKLFAAARIAMAPVPGARIVLRSRKNKVAEGIAERMIERRRDLGFLERP
ncbi:MAG: ATPase domain-containing protein [Candidatus Solibacter sp.]